MPQINQLADVAYSQFFWLLLVLAIIYFGIGRAMLPKIQSTVDARDSRIAEDLAGAQRARAEADETEEAYRARMDESRAEAQRVTQAAKQATAKEAEERIRKADAKIGKQADAAEAKLRAATDAALADIESVATEAAGEMVARLAGLSVSRERAAQAVKAALTHG
jgi:F-type H+-transporting ATPase subunit b